MAGWISKKHVRSIWILWIGLLLFPYPLEAWVTDPSLEAILRLDGMAERLRREQKLDAAQTVVTGYLQAISQPATIDAVTSWEDINTYLQEWTGYTLNLDALPAHTLKTLLGPAGMTAMSWVESPFQRRGTWEELEASVERTLEVIREGNLFEVLPTLAVLYTHPRTSKQIRQATKVTFVDLLPHFSLAELLFLDFSIQHHPRTFDDFNWDTIDLYAEIQIEQMRRWAPDAARPVQEHLGVQYYEDVLDGVLSFPEEMLKAILGAYVQEDPTEVVLLGTIPRGTTRLAADLVIGLPRMLEGAPQVLGGLLTAGAIGTVDGRHAGLEGIGIASLLLPSCKPMIKRWYRTSRNRHVKLGSDVHAYRAKSPKEMLEKFVLRKPVTDILRFLQDTYLHEQRVNVYLEKLGISQKHVDLKGSFGKAQPEIAEAMADPRRFTDMPESMVRSAEMHSQFVDHHQLPETPASAMHRVVDSWDALTSQRNYKEALAANEAMAILAENAITKKTNNLLDLRAVQVWREIVEAGGHSGAWKRWEANWARGVPTEVPSLSKAPVETVHMLRFKSQGQGSRPLTSRELSDHLRRSRKRPSTINGK